jgi:hypothetical protein
MNLKFVFAISIPIIVLLSLVIFSSSKIGFSAERESPATLKLSDVVTNQYDNDYKVLVQTITLKNSFFLPRKYDLPNLAVCLNDKDGIRQRAYLQFKFDEAEFSRRNGFPIIGDFYSSGAYSRVQEQHIEVPANAKKLVKVRAQPKYFYNSKEIESSRNYDEIAVRSIQHSGAHGDGVNDEPEIVLINECLFVRPTNRMGYHRHDKEDDGDQQRVEMEPFRLGAGISVGK